MITTPWRPNGGPVVENQIFAIGDVHGQAEALERLLTHISTIQPAGKQRDIIFLGDLIDRGPENLRSIDLALGADQFCDRRIILPGNHELMMLRAMRYGRNHYGAFMHWFDTGGSAVVDEICPNPKAQPAEILEALPKHVPEEFIEMMTLGQTYHADAGILFIHAGLLPGLNTENFLNEGRFFEPHRYHWAWVRGEFLHHRGGWAEHGFELVVHGHTPQTREPIDDLDQFDVLQSHQRINLDYGAAAIPQVAAVEFVGDKHRLHIAEAPRFLD